MNYRDHNPNRSCLPPAAYLRLTGAVQKPSRPIIPITIPNWLRRFFKLGAALFLFGCQAQTAPPDKEDKPAQRKITVIV
jgi:hypothetical protein